jgi:hypothetical protein
MLRHGLHPKVVADRLGHSTTRLTLDVYSHVLPAMETEAATWVGDAMREAVVQHLVSISTPTTITQENGNAANPCGVRLRVVGARGLEPLTPTVSKSVRSAIKRHFGRLKTSE